MNAFKELGLHDDLVKAVSDLGFESPTPIQEQAIPMVIDGQSDLIGLAQTGTGKTAAFGLPLLQQINADEKHTQALIVCPTRELCLQITKDLTNFSKYLKGIRTVAVYGGASIEKQIGEMKRGAHIVVATPGRLIDLMGRKAVKLEKVNVVVLDEADEMLNMGFKEDIDNIMQSTREDRRTWLFSATMPNEVRRIAENYMQNPKEVSVGTKNQGNVNIEHVYYITTAREKYRALKRIVDFHPDIFGIVFGRTKIETQEIAEQLIKDGYNADALHGDLSQQQRDKVMGRFRDRTLQLLVATDVAARGIDVNDVTHVINYTLPDEPEVYTHRSGRTARAGKLGVSIAIIHGKEVGKIRQIERLNKVRFTKALIPSGEEICEKQLFNIVKNIHEIEVNDTALEKYLPRIYDELNDLSKEDLIKRFASVEFNRFLSYYKHAPDLNYSGAVNMDADHSYNSSAGYKEIFISIGEKEGLGKHNFFQFLKEFELGHVKVGKIKIRQTNAFFEVLEETANEVVDKLHGEMVQGRKMRAEVVTGSENLGRRSSGGDRGGYKGGNRGGKGGYGGGERKSGGGSYGEKKSYGGDRDRKGSGSGKPKAKKYYGS